MWLCFWREGHDRALEVRGVQRSSKAPAGDPGRGKGQGGRGPQGWGVGRCPSLCPVYKRLGRWRPLRLLRPWSPKGLVKASLAPARDGEQVPRGIGVCRQGLEPHLWGALEELQRQKARVLGGGTGHLASPRAERSWRWDRKAGRAQAVVEQGGLVGCPALEAAHAGSPGRRRLLAAEDRTHGHTAPIKPPLSFLFGLLPVSPDQFIPLTRTQATLLPLLVMSKTLLTSNSCAL